MISVFPMLTFLVFGTNTNQNGYNYKSNFELRAPVTVFKASNTVGQYGQQLEISGYFWCEGTFYCNNYNSYFFDIDVTGFSLSYYVDSIEMNYSSYASVDFDYSFNESLRYFEFNFYYDHKNQVNDNYYMGMGVGNNANTCYDVINYDYFDDYIYDVTDLSVENGYFHTNYCINFEDSSFIDNFEHQISTGLRANIDSESIGYDIGYSEGYSDGVDSGYDSGYSTGHDNGYNEGYSVGFYEGLEADSTALTIFSGILAIGTLPINIFLDFFNFEVLGINFSELVSSMLSVCVCIIIIKKVFATDTGK